MSWTEAECGVTMPVLGCLGLLICMLVLCPYQILGDCPQGWCYLTHDAGSFGLKKAQTIEMQATSRTFRLAGDQNGVAVRLSGQLEGDTTMYGRDHPKAFSYSMLLC